MQQQFIQALRGDAVLPRIPPFFPGNEFDSDSGDPLSVLTSQLPQGNPGQAFSISPTPKPPPTRLKKLLPTLHLLSVWVLLAYFVLWREPEVFEAQTFGVNALEGRWKRWAELGRGTVKEGWGVQVVVCVLHSQFSN